MAAMDFQQQLDGERERLAFAIRRGIGMPLSATAVQLSVAMPAQWIPWAMACVRSVAVAMVWRENRPAAPAVHAQGAAV